MTGAFFTLFGPQPEPSTPPPPQSLERPFNFIQEYFHDGGASATNETLDLEFNAASFKAVLTTAESNYLVNNHDCFAYFCLPHNLIKSSLGGGVDTPYPQTLDSNYPTTMANLVSAYGIDNMYLFALPEWDNDPANQGWAENRFAEAGVGGTRPDIPSGLTRQQAYDQWMHFYLANNHGGNTNHHQLGQLLSVPYATRGYKIQANCVNAGSCFYGYEMGIDRITLQRNNDDISGLVGSVGFIRGAANQYGKTWGWDVSHSRSYGLPGVTSFNSSQVLIAGWSSATYVRSYYLFYFTGADVVMSEGVGASSNGAVTINGRTYNPFGVDLKNFCNFAMTRHPQRGVPHVPVAIMKDHISWVEPRYGQYNQSRYVWYQQMAPTGGDNMMHSLLDLLYPNYNTWGSSTTVAEPWGSGRWGEQFDVLTDRASSDALGGYRAVVLSTNAVVDATMQATLNTYASAGGVVVINAKQLSGTAHETLTGIHLTGSASTSSTVTWDSDSTTTTESFNYSTCTLGTATLLAHSGVSTPQVTKNIVGSGEVWVVMADYMSNAANTAILALGSKVIDVLIARFAAATVSGGNHSNIDYTVNKLAGTSGAATVVTVVNTHASTIWTGTVSIPTGSPVREWIADVTPPSSISGGKVNISASVPGGGVKVYAVG